jgi:hypothetical protein
LSELPRPPGIRDVGGFTRYQADLAPLLARFPGIALGHSNPERWRRIQASMLGVGALLRTADPDDFVFDPDAELRSRTDRRALTILGATLAFGIAVTALLWWSRRRAVRRAARTAARAEAAPAPPAAAAAPTSRPATAPAPASLPRPAATSASPPMPPPAPAAAVQPAAARPAPAAAAPATGRPTLAEPEHEPADLNAVLTRLERAIRQLVPRRVSFRTSLLPELWRCRAEPEEVRRLVLDLVAAAAVDLRSADLKSRGELVVGTRNFAFDAAAAAAAPGAQPGEFARLTVRDGGPGLSDEALDQILDPAQTVRASVPAAAQALRPLGGFVRVESAEGVGTAVHLYFPRAAASPETAKPAQAAE